MTITYPLSVPLEEFSQVDVEAVDINAIQTSSFTGRERVQEFEGDYWKLSIRWDNLNVQLGRQVFAFVQALRKSVGTFVVSFPGYGNSLGAAKDIPSSPIVNGGGQEGNRVLNVTSVPVSIENWLLAGDVIQVGPDTRPHWHTVLTDVSTDALGQASIDIWPALRNGVSANDPIVTIEPKGLCRLVSNPTVPIRPPVLYSISIECRESTG